MFINSWRSWLIVVVCATALGSPCAFADDAAASPSPVDFTQSPLNLYFMGDSITHSGKYHQFLQLFFITRYPGQGIWTVNGGYSGETSWGMLRAGYLDQDVKPHNPDVLFVHFGMNDVNRNHYKGRMEPPGDKERDPKRSEYRNAMAKLMDQARERGMTVGVLSPTIYDDEHTIHPNAGERPHLNAELALFGRLGQELAEARDGVFFIDLHTPLNAINQRLLAENPRNSLVGDRVHPRRGGEEVMAFSILDLLDVRSVIYDVQLDAGAETSKVRGAEISDLAVNDVGLSFTLQESALPFPTKRASGKFENVPFDERLNTMRLRVTSLPAGTYSLRIDEMEVGTYTAEQWSQGVDLAANEKTPQYLRSLELLEQTQTKNEYELAVANMRALRNNLRDATDEQGKPLNWGWDEIEPEKVLAAANRTYDQLEAEGKKPSRWRGYVFNEGRKGFGQYHEIMQGLADLRKQWAEQPAVTTHRYQITRGK